MNTFKQYQLQQITPETKNLVRLDNEMETILQDTSKPVDEKARQFSQHLQRYLTMYDKTKSPPSYNASPVLEHSENEERTLNVKENQNGVTKIEEEVLDSVPQSYKGRAQSLLKKLKSHPDQLSWNEKGELMTDGATVSGTNIVDLINDVLRPRKNFSPTGYDEFVQGLAKINTPEDLVRNDARRRLLLEYRNNPVRGSPIARREEETPSTTRGIFPTPPSTGTPPARKRRLPVISSKKQSPIVTRPSQWIRY